MSTHVLESSESDAQRRVALLQTAAYCTAFIGLGLCGGALGPSLGAHAARTGSPLEVVSAVFITSAIGRVIGSLSGGWLLDRTRGHVLIAAGITLTAVMMMLTPFTRSVEALFAVMVAYGVAVNWLDVGANTLIVRVHGAKVGPYMNTLHLSFGVGGGIAPLIVGRSYALTDDVALAYWFIAALLVPLLFWVLRLPAPPQVRASPDDARVRTPIGLLLALGFFFFSMVGVEVMGSQWTFALGERIGLSREVGAPMLASTFWWAYSLARLISIPISTRLSPGKIVVIDLVGTLICAGITLAGLSLPNAQTLVWVGVAGGGLFIASAFPSMLSFIGSRMPLTGAVTGPIFAASNLGVMAIPWSIGQLFDVVGPSSLPITGMLGMAAAIGAFTMVARRAPPPRARA